VLTTGDAFDKFPPKPFRPLITASTHGDTLLAMLKARPARSLPTTYGWLTHADLAYDLIDQ
jgi:hypothetical protein